MPRYVYECEDCEENFEVYHSILEDWSNCLSCKSQAIRRIPCMPITFPDKGEKSRKAGELVEEYIQDSKEELKKEIREAKKEEYKK